MGVFDTAFLVSAIILTTPILFAAVGELVAERAGIINIGLEGMMLVGAFFAFWSAEATGSLWAGVVVGLLAGMALACVMAALSVNAGANQIIVGVGILLLAIGVTSYAFQKLYGNQTQILLDPMASVRIPLLERIPVVGQTLLAQSPLVYIAFLLVPAAAILLYRTTWGLAIRAAGDLPEAAETAGRSVYRIRWRATLTAGALAGVGGAFLSIGQIGTFLHQMTAGRGFLALAAVIFGGWRPYGVLVACFLFGAADALQLRLQGLPSVPNEVWGMLAVLLTLGLLVMAIGRLRLRGRALRGLDAAVVAVLIMGALAFYFVQPSLQLPNQLWLATPYVLTLVALAGRRNRAAMPRFLGIPYLRGAVRVRPALRKARRAHGGRR